MSRKSTGTDRRDTVLLRMLRSPPQPHKPLGKRTKPEAERVRDVAEGLGPIAADIEAAHIKSEKKKKAPPKRS